MKVTLDYGTGGVLCRMSIPSEHWSVEEGTT